MKYADDNKIKHKKDKWSGVWSGKCHNTVPTYIDNTSWVSFRKHISWSTAIESRLCGSTALIPAEYILGVKLS